MIERIITKAKIDFDNQKINKDMPQLIHLSNSAAFMRKLTKKMIAHEIPEFMNIVIVGIFEDLANSIVATESKKVTIKELADTLAMRHSIYFNIGNLNITRVNERADIHIVQRMVKNEIRKMKAAMKKAEVKKDDIEKIMENYDVLSDTEDTDSFEMWEDNAEIDL